MKSILFIFCALLFYTSHVAAQVNSNSTFEHFAQQQDSLFNAAYEKRDAKQYQQLLNEFLAKYNKLDSAGKKYYEGNYINAYYNLCCTYSLINNKPLALAYFNKSLQAGFSDYAHLQEDSDLNNIRNEAQFAAAIAPLRETGDYLYILKKAAAYNENDSRSLPAFTYQDKNNEHLAALRKAFNLDSIAGSGNEVSKIINLLHWVHNLVPHDGNHNNPEVKNAMSMIAVCKRDNRGLNCRGLATVLNECYLSLGFKSRFVTCLPKDSLHTDNDCHVINAVYSNELKKWLWIDPTNDAYVMNEKGELLSIEEVREKIITNQPLIVNPDANWNHKASTLKPYYLYYYMAKNLYMLQCNASSEYDTETYGNGKIITNITLCPLEYFNQKPDKSVAENKDNNTTFIQYKTNNAAQFWQAPAADSQQVYK